MPLSQPDAVMTEDWRSGMFPTPQVNARFLPGGEIRLASRIPASPRARTILDWLVRWAAQTPDAPFITEWVSEGAQRRPLSYGQAWHDSGRIAAGLLALQLRPGDRLIVLAPNGIGHMKIALAALRAGIVYVPIAPQYAAFGADAAKFAGVVEMIRPAAVYCDAVESVPLAVGASRLIEGEAGLDELVARNTDRADPDIAALDPQAPAKLLLTSGSTGTPKPVPYSHALMTDNLQATVDVWPFVTRGKPVLVDWLPWNHAFGGSNNVHLVLSQGGTLHVDESRGRPEAHARCLKNLRDLRPTFHGAVPAGWSALLPTIEADGSFREAFFGRLDAMFSAGAAMSADLFDRLSRASALVRGRPIPILTGWGATETGPGATLVHECDVWPGWIGTPVPGAEIRLVPHGDKYELRVRGPSVMPGYWERPDLTAKVFDEEGFYRTGDAGKLVDPNNPDLGLSFDGRLADDFKLANGSWVNVSRLRLELLRRADGALYDIVIVGADRPCVAALCWVAEPTVLDDLFAAHNLEHRSQTTRIGAFAALSPPPCAETGELTAKGEINRRALLARRPDAVAALYEGPILTTEGLS
jgi:feruloyl-CoA synthase